MLFFHNNHSALCVIHNAVGHRPKEPLSKSATRLMTNHNNINILFFSLHKDLIFRVPRNNRSMDRYANNLSFLMQRMKKFLVMRSCTLNHSLRFHFRWRLGDLNYAKAVARRLARKGQRSN